MMEPLEPKPATRGRDLDHVAGIYDFVHERLSLGKERLFREKTMDYMDVSPADRVLDVGCGTGSLTLLVARRLRPPGEAVGIDAAPRMIRIAREKAQLSGLPASFRVMVAEELDFPDACFDVVVNSMFAHHVDRELKQRSFREMYRVLRPGGTLVTADIDRPTTPMGWLAGWGGRWLLLQPELEDNLRGLLPDLMQEAGFTDLQRRDHLFGLASFFTARRPGERP
jgi:ubiquinone/menaquinone biosynthesis C-methylase UbiE